MFLKKLLQRECLFLFSDSSSRLLKSDAAKSDAAKKYQLQSPSNDHNGKQDFI